MPDERPDGGDVRVADLTPEEFSQLVRAAVADAVLGAVGTVLLVAIGFLLFWAGAASAAAAATGEAPAFALVGLALALVGVYVAAAALDYAPSIEELLFGD